MICPSKVPAGPAKPLPLVGAPGSLGPASLWIPKWALVKHQLEGYTMAVLPFSHPKTSKIIRSHNMTAKAAKQASATQFIYGGKVLVVSRLGNPTAKAPPIEECCSQHSPSTGSTVDSKRVDRIIDLRPLAMDGWINGWIAGE